MILCWRGIEMEYMLSKRQMIEAAFEELGDDAACDEVIQYVTDTYGEANKPTQAYVSQIRTASRENKTTYTLEDASLAADFAKKVGGFTRAIELLQRVQNLLQ